MLRPTDWLRMISDCVEPFMSIKLQSVTRNLRLKYYGKSFISFWPGEWALGYQFLKFTHFSNIS